MRRNSGQTLVIALIIMGILLILGFVFLGFLDQNLANTATSQKESVATQIAEAGVKFAQEQLLHSPQGADWRPVETTMAPDAGNPNDTRDPDALYLRPGSGLAFNAADPNQVDLGGPDGLGFYTRVNFQNGRALVRVRYAPSDANIFSSSPTGALRNPGAARNYIIIEAVGRPGSINPNDPTSGGAGPLVQITGFGAPADVQTAIAAMKANEVNFNTSRKLVAFSSIGMLESGLYVTNKDRTTRPADIGFSVESGANYMGTAVSVPQQFGGLEPVFNPGSPPVPAAAPVPLGGSIYSNADLLIHGSVLLNMNQTLGDTAVTNGTITAASNSSSISLAAASYTGAAWTTSTSLIGAAQLNNAGAFSTYGGLLRDGYDGTDAQGYSRGIGYKAPPLIDGSDPDSGANRYMLLTRDSGTLAGAANTGMYGFGRGVFVNNIGDNQLPATSGASAAAGGGQSLVYDWLNPDNGSSNSAWRGPFYVPPGAYLLLQADGFTITKDQGVWTNPDGSATANPQASLRFRLGFAADGRVHIVNALTPGIGDINGTGLNYSLGPVFNGVLDFTGNVRVRGVIPTDCQLTVVSGGSIYIEGSIVKGVVGTDVATDVQRGRLLTRPSKASCMLMAKQYVTLNTTQFVGPTTAGYAVDSAGSADDSAAPAVLKTTGDTLALYHSFLLQNQPSTTNPAVNPYNPSTWVPYDSTYQDASGKLTTNLLLRESMDPTSGAAAYMSLSINDALGTPMYLFSLDPATGFNAATSVLGANYVEPGYTTPGYAAVYGLGAATWQRYGHFESTVIPLINSNFTYNAATQTLTSPNTNPNGTYSVALNQLNEFDVSINALGSSPTSAYYLARAAVVPSDIRIEASMYAENGSFFVIPGPWFNPNPNDTRQAYLADVTATGSTATADADRLQNFGSLPASPFYGEPIDCRVTIYGSVTENMPAPASMQSDWQRKWGWIPIAQGASGRTIPIDHQQVTIANAYVPNLQIVYDPVLATGRVAGFAPSNGPAANDPYLRTDAYGRPLAPFPCLPVSPTLEYFGDEQF